MNCNIIALLFFMTAFTAQVFGQEENNIATLEKRVQSLELQMRSLALKQQNTQTEVSRLQETIRNNGLALVLFAFFCAWWAKSTGRSSLLWFFLGLLFHVFTAIALLIKTERGT